MISKLTELYCYVKSEKLYYKLYYIIFLWGSLMSDFNPSIISWIVILEECFLLLYNAPHWPSWDFSKQKGQSCP